MYALADCNNFFVSCERVFRPDLNGRPVIVLSNNDGCAVARSNEAKALGIKMGDPLFKIKNIVDKHGVAVFSGNMALYGDMSNRVRYTLQEFSPLVEVYSIDEAFLDLHGMLIDNYDAYAKTISARCLQYTGIPVSVGIAPTKTLAKIASKLCKQYPKLQGGCYMHRAEDIQKVLKNFPVADVWGIGSQSVQKLLHWNVKSAFDFTQLPEATVRSLMGITGVRTWQELQGIPAVQFEDVPQVRKSICVSRSFASEIYDCATLSEQVANFALKAAEKLRGQHSLCAEMTVFAYTNRFKDNLPQTVGSTLVCFATPTQSQRQIVAAAVQAVRDVYCKGYGYKKAGVVFTKLEDANYQMHSLFEDVEHRAKEDKLSQVMDAIRVTYGNKALTLGAQGNAKPLAQSNNQSPHYTTLWSDLPQVTVK